MTSVMGRLVLASLLTLPVACLADLRPDVGDELTDGSENPSNGDDGEVGGRDGSASGSDGSEGPGGDGSDPSDGASADGADPLDGSSGDGETGDGGSGDGGTGDGSGDGGDGSHNGCDIVDTDRGKDVSFYGDVWPILSGCRCHNSSSDDPFAIVESGLTIDTYATLREGGDNTMSDVIVPGNACLSIILQKLSETPPFGERMPLDGPYLSPEQRTIISDWIVEGAHEN